MRSGTKIWDRRYGGGDLDYMYDMVIAPDGGFLFAGLTWSSDQMVSELSRGMGDFWVIKVNDSGNKQWDKRFGSPGNEWAYRVVVTTDGNYLASGETSGAVGGERSENSRGGEVHWQFGS